MNYVVGAQISTPRAVAAIDGAPGIAAFGNYGWGAFTHGAMQEELQPIRFSSAILFPKYPQADGFKLFQPKQMHGTYQPLLQASPSFNININSTEINLISNFISWANSTNASNGWSEQGWETSQFYLPNFGGGTPGTNGLNEEAAVGSGSGNIMRTAGIWLPLIALASEIAQSTVALNSAQTSIPFPLQQGAFYNTPATGTIRSAQIVLNDPPEYQDVMFGSTGANYFGWLSFEYNGFYGPPRYINGPNAYFLPEESTVTGVLTFLKPGCGSLMTLGVNDFQLQALQTSLGELSFITGSFPTGLFTKVAKP
jgi:hypothetical protein